jgi:hypothetical protein
VVSLAVDETAFFILLGIKDRDNRPLKASVGTIAEIRNTVERAGTAQMTRSKALWMAGVHKELLL